MDGNIPRGSFLGRNFPGRNLPGGSLIRGNFPVRNFPSGSFPDTKKNKSEEFSSVHASQLVVIGKSSFFKPIASVFSRLRIITFFYGAEILPQPLVQLTGHISALIGYTEMSFLITYLMMICGWTTLVSQCLLKNDHKRQQICQIRHEKGQVVCPVFQVCLF